MYQRMIAGYREPARVQRKKLMQVVIHSISTGVPAALTELKTLRRTLKRRSHDVLANFDRPGTSNGHTEESNGRLEHLRGSTLGFRKLTNYIARALWESGGFRRKLRFQSRRDHQRQYQLCGIAVPNGRTNGTNLRYLPPRFVEIDLVEHEGRVPISGSKTTAHQCRAEEVPQNPPDRR